ncbi:hypothetical protein M9H77_31365 [Catharanthus roseus]|uniref:Uncharacterized protein n=1 Tax=Catharanthus roseus TaxID=4058 RepID=A0ACB9ZZV4_CATRO|nr:hypothetical protein M9H77_31365 [Catharanthus roseus]
MEIISFSLILLECLERRYFIEFNSLSCATPRVDKNNFNVPNCVSWVLGVEDSRSMGKSLALTLDQTIEKMFLRFYGKEKGFGNGLEEESFQRSGGWYDLKSARNYRAIARFNHKSHGEKKK